MSWLLEAYRDGRTYSSLGYLLVSLPLGILGFTVVIFGFALGLGLVITLVGIPILVMTLLFVRAFSTFHGRLAWSMLHAPLPRRPAPRAEEGVFWTRLLELTRSRRTWREVVFMILGLPLGIVGFTLAVTVVALMFGGLAQPIVLAFGVESQLGSWVIDTPRESLIYLPVSIFFLFVGPRLLLGIGSGAGRIVTAFLGRLDSSEIKSAVASSLARDASRDAFTILIDLELRFGRGPFLSPTHVQAALLALESDGRVIVERRRPHSLYALSR